MDYNLEDGKTYVMVANGILSESGYNPFKPFDIYVYDMGREFANENGNTDLLVFHGSTDAPTVDIVETSSGETIIIDNLMYGDYQGYLELPTADYQLTIKDESGQNMVAVYMAPLASFGFQDEAIITVNP